MNKKLILVSKLFRATTESEAEKRRDEWCEEYLRELEEFRMGKEINGMHLLYATCVVKGEK